MRSNVHHYAAQHDAAARQTAKHGNKEQPGDLDDQIQSERDWISHR